MALYLQSLKKKKCIKEQVVTDKKQGLINLFLLFVFVKSTTKFNVYTVFRITSKWYSVSYYRMKYGSTWHSRQKKKERIFFKFTTLNSPHFLGRGKHHFDSNFLSLKVNFIYTTIMICYLEIHIKRERSSILEPVCHIFRLSQILM